MVHLDGNWPVHNQEIRHRDCFHSKKWPDNSLCFDDINVCFGERHPLCSWDDHEVIGKCTGPEDSKSLIKCLTKYKKFSEKVSELFSKCFDDKASLGIMFEIYGANANRRNYYTVESHFYSHALGETRCHFTKIDQSYHLTQLASNYSGRPSVSIIPMETYVKDNYYWLLKRQRQLKDFEAKNPKDKK